MFDWNEYRQFKNFKKLKCDGKAIEMQDLIWQKTCFSGELHEKKNNFMMEKLTRVSYTAFLPTVACAKVEEPIISPDKEKILQCGVQC